MTIASPIAIIANWQALESDDLEAASTARLMLSGLPMMLVLTVMLAPLLVVHFCLATVNVTTREHFKWLSAAAVDHSKPSVPCPGSYHWLSYAPYDQGVVRNWLAFARGTRDAAPPGAALKGGSHAGTDGTSSPPSSGSELAPVGGEHVDLLRGDAVPV